VELALQIIGFEQDAMALIQEYDWPGNQTQFKRVLRHLATITTTSYIRIEDVEAVLKQERSYMTGYPTVAGECNINLNRTLEDITSDIICRVLIECGNNQSAAAKRLGISRTTLWRYLKR
jgi:transcriptional regulator of acetoin/glycerol metabolism